MHVIALGLCPSPQRWPCCSDCQCIPVGQDAPGPAIWSEKLRGTSSCSAVERARFKPEKCEEKEVQLLPGQQDMLQGGFTRQSLSWQREQLLFNPTWQKYIQRSPAVDIRMGNAGSWLPHGPGCIYCSLWEDCLLGQMCVSCAEPGCWDMNYSKRRKKL